jgi:hypothetical protein
LDHLPSNGFAGLKKMMHGIGKKQFEKEISSVEMKQPSFRSGTIQVGYKYLYRKTRNGSSYYMFQGLSREDIIIKYNISPDTYPS